jgi:alkanesulfonate monooxygenase SsuD/methylene tetrahydromethanopterin reductase-like flavin-dependent oxidoreductase (luciferase family)
MFACNRSSHKGIPLMVRATTNPYGRGHNWVKAYFIDVAPPGQPHAITREIPALEDGELVRRTVQIEAYRQAWKDAGHAREPRVSVSRSIFALVNDRDRAYFGRDGRSEDSIGYIDANTRAIFGRSYAAEPAALIKQLAADEAIAAADTLLLTVPNQLGVDYNAHVIESILEFVAPELGWR